MAFNKGKESKRRSDQEKKGRGKFESKSITRIVISLFVAIAAFIGATYYESYLLSDKNVTTVVVATADVKAGTLIDDKNVKDYFKTKDVNSGLVSDNTFQSLDQVVGKAAVDISKDEIITSQRLYRTDSVRDKFNDPVVVTYTVSDAAYASGGAIREGDIVDILELSVENGLKSSRVLIKDAYVLTARDSGGTVIARDDTSTAATQFDVYVERTEETQFNPKTHDQIVVNKVVLP